jgi:Raf kinase inhibitor-like YbhB/YbcL family protein
METEVLELTVSTPAFQPDGNIHSKYTCDGEGVNSAVVNSSGKTGYHPPCPPSGTHRYYFHVFALDNKVDLLQGETKDKLQQAMNEHILAKGTIMGKYQKR